MAEVLTGLPGPLLAVVVVLVLVVESGLLVGVAVPGTAVALGAGVAAHAGALPLPVAVAASALGTVAGGQLAFGLGRRRRHLAAPFAGISGLTARPWPPLRRSMGARPVVTVLVAQWLSSGRLLVPRAAGWSRMGHRRFTAAHTPAAIVWAATLTGIGYLATAAVRDQVALGLGLAAGAAVLVGLAVLLRRGRRLERVSHLGALRHGVRVVPVPRRGDRLSAR